MGGGLAGLLPGPPPGIDWAGTAGGRSAAMSPRELVREPILRLVRAKRIHHIARGSLRHAPRPGHAHSAASAATEPPAPTRRDRRASGGGGRGAAGGGGTGAGLAGGVA